MAPIGLLNLAMVVLFAANFRLGLENFIKYGVRIKPGVWFMSVVAPQGNLGVLLCWPALLFFCLFALCIERFASARLKAERKVTKWALECCLEALKT